MSVGASADRDLMEAIAFAGGGTWIDVPGGTTIVDMQEQMLGAFSEIAAKVPPPKLVYFDCFTSIPASLSGRWTNLKS